MSRAFVLMGLFACSAWWARPSAGEGALAIALPPSVAKQGFTYRYETRHATTGAAQSSALEGCRETSLRDSKNVDEKIKKDAEFRASICKVIVSFHDQCVAVAMDPAAGTSGVGWAVAADLRSAESQALAQCETTAGPGRRAACKIDKSACDGTAK